MRQRSLALLNSIKILRRRIRIVKASVLGCLIAEGIRRDMTAFLHYFKGWSWSSVHKDQLASIARATPAATVGDSVNIVLAFIAFRNTIPSTPLAIWGSAALSLCWYVGGRSLRRSCSKAGDEGQPVRSASKAMLFGLLLALPWSVLAAAFAGTTATDGEVILIALTVGMAASGSVLLSPIPAAALIYAATILLPISIKCLFLASGNHLMLGALGMSFLVFLIGLIASNARIFAERMEATNRLKETVDALVEAREETDRVAMTDGLTGVANRRAFMGRLNMLGNDNAQASEYGVFYIDLDRFKGVNDALGHAAGDAVLRMAASRITKTVREKDLVARLGGDEFAVVAQDVPGRATASALAERLVTVLREPFFLEGQRVQIGASVGVAIASESDASGDVLLKQADLAMYAGKTAGRNAHCIFEADMQRSAEERQAVERGLRVAIAKSELELLLSTHPPTADRYDHRL